MSTSAFEADARPDPDVLLARAKRDAEAETRGKLRIYFGASAGVGKTYAMLQAGRRLAREGVDVVAGIVETHGRRETAALLDGDTGGDRPLDVIPRHRPAASTAGGPSASAEGGPSASAAGGPSASAEGGPSASAASGPSASAEDGPSASAASGPSASAAGGPSASAEGGPSASAAGGPSASAAGGPSASAAGGPTADEFDLDATLARKPKLVLVDELAHSNVAGSRHPKRWQDVDELLTAGIDVFTTLNVQHLESLNDIVGGITGVRVWETVPDTFFDRADEVIVVDIPADELLKRLAAGKVYMPEQAERAARNFFRKGNLIALREIALRRTADRVEDDVQAYREEASIDRVWATEAALLCCIGPDAGSERVVRSAARLAGQVDVPWHAIYVETPRLQKRPTKAREAILQAVRLAEQLGATTAVLSGNEVAEVIARYAREHNLSRLVLGRGNPPGIVARWFGAVSMDDGIALHAPEIDVIVVGRASATRTRADAEPDADTGSTRLATTRDDDLDDPASAQKRAQVRMRFVYAALVSAVVTGAALPIASVLDPTNIAMVYLLAITLIAMRLGRGPAVLASFASVAAFDFFFVPPRFSFAVADVQYLVTFGVMLTVALVIGTLAANLRYQARVAAHRADRARSLYEVARDLSKAMRTDDVVAQGRAVVATLFDAEVHVLLPRGGATPNASRDRLEIDDTLARSAGFEPAIAQWSYERSLPAGAGTDTLSGSRWLFLPLVTSNEARAVLAVRPTRRRLLMIPEQRRLLETFGTLIAIALERVHYVDVAQSAIVRVEAERLRNSILSALSHDLRTPIAAMAGLAETLEMTLARDGGAQDDVDAPGLVAAIRDEVQRMSALVENLLDMARIESGDVQLNRQWHSIEETIGTALAGTGRLLAGHRIETSLPRELPLVQYDAVLIERVLVNLLENAGKYTPPGSTVRIAATAGANELRVTVEDDGPGLPSAFDTVARIATLFDKFTRGERESPRSGAGLGLAICRAIVEAHGGTIHGERPAAGGARFVVVLPRSPAPAVDDERAGAIPAAATRAAVPA